MPTPAWPSRLTEAGVFMFVSQTAWLAPYAVPGTVPSPSSALIETSTALVDAWDGAIAAVSATPTIAVTTRLTNDRCMDSWCASRETTDKKPRRAAF